MNRHILKGCAPTPFSNYLKTIGLFKIIAEQKDPKITACWSNDRLILHTELSEDEIVEFVLKQYRPSPIVAPWSYNKYQKAITQCKDVIGSERFKSYKETVDQIENVISEFCKITKIEEFEKSSIDKKTKPLFLRLCRNTLPDDAIPWLDAVFVLTGQDVKFAPILGSGANDGNFDMAANFLTKLKILLDDKNIDESKAWLESALFGKTAKLDEAKMVGHNPDGAGGPNSGTGFEGKSLSNPWEYILMMEGIVMFGGSIARRQSTSTDKAIFPFTTNAANIGYATASSDDGGSNTRGEIWLPIWQNLVTYKELAHVCNEGRVELDGKQAKTSVEFARAIASYGAERGISEFQQFCILKRKGDAYLTINADKIRVAYEPAVHLLSEMDPWYKPIIKQSVSKGASAPLKRMVRNLDNAVLKFCKYQTKQLMLEVLILVGKLEGHVSRYEDLKTTLKLSTDWLEYCYDNSVEFRLAASVASIRSKDTVGSIRTNMEKIVREKGDWKYRKESISAVWNENDDILRNMSRILLRRSIDAKIKSANSIPIEALIPAKIDDVNEFLDGNFDAKKMFGLLPALSIIEMTSNVAYPWKNVRGDATITSLPEAYIIIKSIHPPNPKEDIPFNSAVLNLLSAGRIDDAYAKASYILHSHGLSPLRYSKKTGVAQSATLSDIARRHIMAALLIPISQDDRKNMLKQVIIPADDLTA